ncbi:hypothetical protein HK100_009850 [Physocladia obscura]|uniref:Phosphoglycerate mutase-like protein n=1 Tax=Physocladia obscura TaxID=109957 RepID=A0AAD5T907_9FUNG|nr:hypothetical protein HK100_009850 [Physocladia obscura]
MFLASRTKTIHFVRHAEGTHNAANHAHGDDTPTLHSTPGAWTYEDARLTDAGIAQCLGLRASLAVAVSPQLVVVSPFSRALQTAHLLFANGGAPTAASTHSATQPASDSAAPSNIFDNINSSNSNNNYSVASLNNAPPFIVHHLCAERSGRYTCDKRRNKNDIITDFQPIFDATLDRIDFDSFGFPDDADIVWSPERESSESVSNRAIKMMEWLATRPESDIAVVTHSSWLKHLFAGFGGNVATKDKLNMHRLTGNAEVRSVCLAMHRGFYPEGEWKGDTFIPSHKSFHRFRYAPTPEALANMHKSVQ